MSSFHQLNSKYPCHRFEYAFIAGSLFKIWAQSILSRSLLSMFLTSWSVQRCFPFHTAITEMLPGLSHNAIFIIPGIPLHSLVSLSRSGVKRPRLVSTLSPYTENDYLPGSEGFEGVTSDRNARANLALYIKKLFSKLRLCETLHIYALLRISTTIHFASHLT